MATVKTYTRRTKSGKRITVKAHSRRGQLGGRYRITPHGTRSLIKTQRKRSGQITPALVAKARSGNKSSARRLNRLATSRTASESRLEAKLKAGYKALKRRARTNKHWGALGRVMRGRR